MTRRLLVPFLLLLALFAAACGERDESENTASAPTEEATPEPAATATQEGCQKVAEPEPREQPDLKAPKEELDPAKKYVATVVTSCGEFEITLDSKQAPKTGGSFKFLADEGFFNGLVFHRIVPGFVIQGGDPLGTGEGGPGYSVVEAPPEDLAYVKGVVAMAKTAAEEPGTSGSQFFVVTGEDAGLPPEYAYVGKVTKGLDIVERIGVVEVGPDDRPTSPVVMQQVKVEER